MGMLEESDIKRLSEVFVTKVEFNARMDEFVTKLDFNERMDLLMTAVDGMAKSIYDLRHEYIAIKMQLDRHEKWIKEIAAKTGVTLSVA